MLSWTRIRWRDAPEQKRFRLLFRMIRVAIHEINHWVTAKIIGAKVKGVDLGHIYIRRTNTRYDQCYNCSKHCLVKTIDFETKVRGFVDVTANDEQNAFLDKIHKNKSVEVK